MKRAAFVFVLLFVCGVPAAHAQYRTATVQGFGGLTFGTSSFDFGGSSFSSNVGGSVSGALTPNIELFAEGGRMTDIKPPFLDLLDLTPVGLRVSAWYGTGGVRLIASPQHTVRPYAEASAGFARLRAGVSGLDGLDAALVNTALGFLNTTEPVLGFGGGLMLGSGPIAVDIGYRYKRIDADGVPSILNAGKTYQVNEARIGIGVRF